MKRKDFLKMVKERNKELRKMLAGKAEDYAGVDDALSRFDRVAALVYILDIDATRPEGVAFLMMCLKLDRLSHLVFSGKTPANESLTDSFQDLRGYTHLAEAIIEEAYGDHDVYTGGRGSDDVYPSAHSGRISASSPWDSVFTHSGETACKSAE